MFKVNYMNGETLDTVSTVSNVLGKSLHKALEVYFGGGDYGTPTDEGEAIKLGHEIGLKYLDNFSDGYVKYGSTIPNRQNMNERYAFSYFGIHKELNKKDFKEVVMIEKTLHHHVEVEGHVLPIPLKGKPDLVYYDRKGRLIIRDWKFTQKYSAEMAIDGAKLIQAAFNFFLVYAETGIAPHSMVFHEFKIIENSNHTRQSKEFEIVFADHPLMFDLFFRLYQDVTDGLMGKQVYVPNVYAMFDKEISILAYIYRLDQEKERAEAFKEMQVDNITDFLKKRLQKEGAMKKYLEVVSEKFISATTLNYKDMKIEERIKMKLAEHGIGVEFDSKVTGRTVTLYRYEPSIGVKMSRIASFTSDIEQVIERSGIRILAPIPDSGLIGFEVPNKTRTFPVGIPKNEGFALSIGETIMGEVRRFDIRTAPHILVAGTTGSGKSVWLNSIIEQLLTIPNVKLHLFDPKQVELFHFEGVSRVQEYKSEPIEIAASLFTLVKEMEKRYAKMKEARVRNVEQMPSMGYRFVVIDEFADLSMRGEIGNAVQLLAQKGRACGIHMILATQRASTHILAGDIKINFPTKVVFRMSKSIDSRVMIDEDGAEKLLGKGDMLFVTENGTERLQGYSA